MIFPVAQATAAADDDASGLDGLVRLLSQVDDPAFHLDVLKGMQQALAGQKDVEMPTGWPAAYRRLSQSPQAEVRRRAMELALIFGDRQARQEIQNVLHDRKAERSERQAALQALVNAQTPGLAPRLHRLLDDSDLRAPVLRALAAYNHPATPQVILKMYPSLAEPERRDAISTLASRPSYALALLEAIENGKIPSSDLSAFTVRQLQAFENKTINARLNEVWGTVRQTSQEKSQLIARYKSKLSAESLSDANLSLGRLVFARTCQQCHRLYGEGGTIGPDLTGSNRANLDYVLENVLAPNDVIGKDYRLQIVVTAQGRLITGIIAEQTDRTLTLQTANEQIILDKSEIVQMKVSPLSMMPEGLFDKLTDQEIRDLVAYLASPTQVDLPPNHKLEKPPTPEESPNHSNHRQSRLAEPRPTR